jgi:hypothetical protein
MKVSIDEESKLIALYALAHFGLVLIVNKIEHLVLTPTLARSLTHLIIFHLISHFPKSILPFFSFHFFYFS